MRKIAILGLGMLVAAFMAVSARAAEEGKSEKKAEKIALDQVPAAVKAAAEQAVKGLVLTAAEKETKKGELVYELTGKAGGKEYEVKVSPEGKVLKVEEADAEEEKGEKKKEK